MNQIKVENIKVDGAFSEDAYIFDTMIFMPKKTKIKPFHIDALKNWKIEDVLCEGEFLATGRNNTAADLPPATDGTKPVIESPAFNVNLALLDEGNAGITQDKELRDIYCRWIIQLAAFFTSIIKSKDINRNALQTMMQEMENTVWKKSDALQLLMGSNMKKISRVYRQSVDCALYSLMMAKRMNMAALLKNNLLLGALFHDIGMLKIPVEILTKKTPLTDDDRKIIRNHTVSGFVCLRDAKFTPVIASAALQHHERIDGSGYPEGKSFAEITNVGKIVGILDTYCASISAKEFSKPVHAKEAVHHLLQLSGTAFDAQLVKEFAKSISFYPLGSMVILSNDALARVIGNSGIAMRPIVQATIDGKEVKIDLRTQTDLYVKSTFVPNESENQP